MLHSKLILAAMAAVLAIGTGAAFAATGEHEDAGEVAAMLAAKVSPPQAITTAEQQLNGRAMKIDVENEKGTFVYEGVISRILDREGRAELSKLAGSPTTLSAAVATAERQTGGKAVKAGYEDENGRMLFEVEVAKDKAVHKVMIDAATGEVVR